MESHEAVEYLERLDKKLRRALVRSADDDDYYQQASLELLNSVHKHTAYTDADFMILFRWCFSLVKRRLRDHAKRHDAQFKTFSLEEYRDSMGSYQLNHYANDPRHDKRQDAKEYIELLPVSYRPAFECVYVEGLTYEETAQRLGYSAEGIRQLLGRGVELIRTELEEIN